MASHSNGNLKHALDSAKRQSVSRGFIWASLIVLAAIGNSRIEKNEAKLTEEVMFASPEKNEKKTLSSGHPPPLPVYGMSQSSDYPDSKTSSSHDVSKRHTTLNTALKSSSHSEKNSKAEKKIDTDFSMPYGESIFVELTINRIVQGSYPVIPEENGDYLLRALDLKAIGIVVPNGMSTVHRDDDYVSLKELGATAIEFDELSLTLAADLPAQKLPRQETNFQEENRTSFTSSGETSAYINYRLLNSGSDTGDEETWLLGSELGIRYGELLFENESDYFRHGDNDETIRYGTSVTYDNRETLQRLIVGDFAASSGHLGSAVNYGGISFTKTYSINPHFIQQPMAGFATTVSSPSEVDIYLDDIRLRTETVEPGLYEFKNLNYYGGRHDLEMVIRDRFGREQRIAYPYYFSSQNLRRGLHDYSYNAGRIRNGVGTSDDEYGEWAVSAYHRYGLTDSLTLGGRGEAGSGILNLGPTSVYRMDRWGLLSASVAVSKSQVGAGWAASAGYAYQQRDFHLQAYWRRYTSDYEIVGRLSDSDRPEQEIVAAAGYTLSGIGNVGASLRQLTQYQGDDQKVASLTYSRTINNHFRLMATASHADIAQSSNYFYIGLSYHPGPSVNALLRHQHTDESYTNSLQIGNTTPVGEGLGYRVTADHTVTDNGQSVRLSPWGQYNGRYGIYTANVQHITNSSGEDVTGYQWGISGGIGIVGDTINFSRPISDSFALVDVGGLEGVRVYQSAREIGRTNENGQVFLPNLGSYQVNHIAIDARDIPMDRSINASEVYREPGLRSGTLIQFEVNQHQAVSGRVLVKLGTVWLPVEYAELTIDVDGKTIEVPTGRGGEFYLENMKPGHYPANFTFREHRCDFDLSIPDSDEMMIELGELNTCELPQ